MLPPLPSRVELARQYFARNALSCADAVMQGRLKLPEHTCPVGYIEHCDHDAAEWLSGRGSENTFTFRQIVHWLETGEMRALLPK